MVALEFLLWGYFIGYPIYIYFTHEQLQASVVSNPEKRIGVYQETIVHLWLPASLVFILLYSGVISAKTVGLVWRWDMANQIALAGLVLLAVVFLISLQQLRRDDKCHQDVRDKFAFIKWFMPTNTKEARYFLGGVTITAGICEELLFRGYLIPLLSEYSSVYMAVIVSSIAFGLPHIYQGAVNVVRTAILGAIAAVIFVVTESLTIPILLHIIVDLYSGYMAYIVFKTPVDVKATA